LIETLTIAFAQAWALDGLGVLIAVVFVAGLVRGFTGFGTAMIYMPFASTVLSPVAAIITILVFDMFGPLPNIPRALRDGTPRDVARLGIGALIGLPIGLFLLYRIDPQVFRWLVSFSALTLLALLITGWRYHGELARWMVFVVGAIGGLLGGVSGLAGPPVIMLYMASKRAVQVIRANILLYLFITDIMALLILALTGVISLNPVIIGLLLTIPYTVANVIGGWLFRPELEKAYRWVAYILIGTSALVNLPFFGI
jgi:uncharacterized membrane protein YfcA